MVSLCDFLEDENFNVICSNSAEEAYRLIEKENCTVAIVDLNLPGESGEDFIEKVHAMNLNPMVKFILQTGDLNYTISDKMVKCGLTEDNIVHKPVLSINIIEEKINQLISE